MSIKINKFKKLKKDEEDCSLIINEDIYEQESDEEQIIQNEERDEECSFISNKSDKIKIKHENDSENNMNEVIENINNPENNIIIEESNKSINLENNTNNIVNNENSDISNQIQTKESITNTNTNDLNTNKISKSNSRCKFTKKVVYKKNISNKKALIPNNNSSYNNIKNKNKSKSNNNNNKFKKEKENNLIKKVQPKIPLTTSHSLIKVEKIKNDKINISNSDQNKSEKKNKKTKGLIKYLKNERSIKMKLNNSNSKIEI